MTAEEAREALRIYRETGAVSPDVHVRALEAVLALRATVAGDVRYRTVDDHGFPCMRPVSTR